MAITKWTLLIGIMLCCLPLTFAQTVWQAMGPRSIPNSHGCDNGAEASLLAAGKIQAFAVNLGDPSVMYAGGGVGPGNSGPASDAGAFKSTDGGAHWTPIDNGLSDRYVDDLWLDQGNPNILLASTFFGGIYRSADGGQTWTNVRPGSTTTILQVGSILYTGAADGVASSSDLGQTWTLAHPTSSPVRALGYGAGAMYAGLDDGTVQVRLSPNATWGTCLAGGNGLSVWDLSVNPTNGLEAIVVLWKLGPLENWITEDGGATWSPFASPAQQSCGGFPGPAQVIAFDSVDPNTIYGGFGGSMWVSNDSGASWTLLHLYEDLRLIYPFPGIGGSLVVGGDQGIYMSQDYGTTWTTLNGDLPTSLLTDVAVSGSEIFTAVQDFSAIQSFDGGSTWLQLSNARPPIGEDGVVLINPGNPQYQLLFNEVGLQFSDDGGQTFIYDYASLPSSEWSWNGTSDYIAVDPSNTQRLYLAGASGIWQSNDYGLHWQSTGWPISNPTLVRVDPSDSNTIFVGQGADFNGPGGIEYTHDGGITWSTSVLPAGSQWPVSLDVDPSDSNTVVVGLSTPPDQAGGGVLLSADGGRTFGVDSLGLQSFPLGYSWHYVYSIRFAPPSLPHLAVAATNNGLYLSRAGGPWVDITGNAIPRWFQAVSWTSDFLYAATYGEGVIRTPLSDLHTFSVQVSASPTSGPVPLTVVFAATPIGGLAPYSCAWNFGDGSSATGDTTSHTFRSAGSFTATATMTDGASESATASVSIAVTVPTPGISAIRKARNPFRLIVTGSSFDETAQVLINGKKVPATTYKNQSKVVAKGGKTLIAMLPKGTSVQVTVMNVDSGAISQPFTFAR